jgi:hypothetical protein
MEYKIGDKVLDRICRREGEIIAIATAHPESEFLVNKMYKVKFITNTMFGKKEKAEWMSVGRIDIINSKA